MYNLVMTMRHQVEKIINDNKDVDDKERKDAKGEAADRDVPDLIDQIENAPEDQKYTSADKTYK